MAQVIKKIYLQNSTYHKNLEGEKDRSEKKNPNF